jgi:hypothetical protein
MTDHDNWDENTAKKGTQSTMTRGKYAAQAANRLAALDNTLLRDKCAQAEALTARVAELETELQAERRNRSARITSRADELSRQAIARAEANVASVREECAQTKHTLANWIAHYLADITRLNPDVEVFSSDVVDIFAQLVGAEHVGEYLAIAFGETKAKFANRKHRRLSRDDVRRNVSEHIQDLAANGTDPDITKFVAPLKRALPGGPKGVPVLWPLDKQPLKASDVEET